LNPCKRQNAHVLLGEKISWEKYYRKNGKEKQVYKNRSRMKKSKVYILHHNVYNAAMISSEKQSWETDFEQCACTGRTLSRFVRPAVLALLAEAPAHGYDLLQRLREFKMFSEAPPDASGVYKTLRAMTDEGLVSGEWDTPDAGSARRPFTLKSKGRKCLAQ